MNKLIDLHDYTASRHCAQCQISDAMLEVEGQLRPLCREPAAVLHREYRRDQYLFFQGDAATHVYILRSGLVKISVILSDGCEQIVDVVGAGQILGLEGLSQAGYDVQAIALTQVRVCKVSVQALKKAAPHSPDTLLRLMAVQQKNLQKAWYRTVGMGQKSASERLAGFLLQLDEAHGETGEFTLPLSKKEVANLLGFTPETLSRLLRGLREQGAIAVAGTHIFIRDAAALRGMGGEDAARCVAI